MKQILPLFIMVDACGWEIIKNDPFCCAFAPNRKRLDSVFGYSSACVPSVVSGNWPEEHRNWSYFVYDPENSPFKWLRPLRRLPRALTSRRAFRRWLTRLVKARLGFRGYFDLYNVPFEQIHLYDFTEKKSPLKPGGMNQGSNIFDWLEQGGIPFFGSEPERAEEKNRDALIGRIEREEIDFAFLYWPGLDGLLHRVGNDSPEIPARLRLYEDWIGSILEAAREHYRQTHLYVFSDHGMANCDQLLDLKAAIDQLGLGMGKDYAVVYDSTMARFWFFNQEARARIEARLNLIPQGRIIPDEELKELRAFFPDRYFGHLIFLVKEGVLIVPSHMGERPLRAMHGYHPSDPQSYAALMTNRSNVPREARAIPDMFRLMKEEAGLAFLSNRGPGEAAASFQQTLMQKEVA
jgi:hypothetical protein